MNPQERDVINGIFDRLKQAEGQPRDPEAEALISERLASQPGAAYLLAQIVHVQEQALTNLNDRVNALEAEVEKARVQAASAPASGGGFLSSLFGASSPPAAQNRPAPRPAGVRPAGPANRPGPAGAAGAGPWGGQSGQSGPSGPWGNRGGGGGGFLASAMTTAAGVAGGMMLGSVLTNAFGLNGSSDPAAAGADQTAGVDPAAADEPADFAQDAGHEDATYQDASYDEGGFDDFGGGDFDGGDDWV